MKYIACSLILCSAFASTTSVTAEENSAPAQSASTASLQERVTQLESEVAELKDLVHRLQSTAQAPPASPPPSSPASADNGETAKEKSKLDFFPGTTINLNIDGYYGYNFNRPVGHVNLLRAYDVTSNSFSLNQANLIVEHAPDPGGGNRLGARVDLQFGQATETLQGSAVNEPRPQVYRPLFQAYGTYVAPLGSGLTVDFGKWASAMGIENNYTKDQMNYSRSYFFNFLPFYHMGVRATYQFNDAVSLTYAVVNGLQQTEDFNGFKSQMMFLTLKPKKTISWNINYHGGQEQPDFIPVLNPTFPIGATQPGLSGTPVKPARDGWLHIFDSYVNWTATPKLTLAMEADYVVNRVFSHSAPTHVDGGTGYVRYQFTPKIALATRAEYLSDRGGLFSGVTQALKETTLTYEYKFAEGLLMRTEWRRDFSDIPFFRTANTGILKKEQNTATVGLVWWFGRKQGAW